MFTLLENSLSWMFTLWTFLHLWCNLLVFLVDSHRLDSVSVSLDEICVCGCVCVCVWLYTGCALLVVKSFQDLELFFIWPSLTSPMTPWTQNLLTSLFSSFHCCHCPTRNVTGGLIVQGFFVCTYTSKISYLSQTLCKLQYLDLDLVKVVSNTRIWSARLLKSCRCFLLLLLFFSVSVFFPGSEKA